MRNFTKILAVVTLLVLTGVMGFAGNPDRSGEAGASELLINPWARSSGWNGVNISAIRGMESMRVNVAGLAYTKKTEIYFSRTIWLSGSDVDINAFGLAQKLGEGALGVSVMSMSLGEIPITTAELPEGTGATYKPRFSHIGVSYSRKFADYLAAGVTIRGISENIADASAFGIAMDVGIQYVTGSDKHPEAIKFGVALRNIGTPMKFGGDGLSFRGEAPLGTYSLTQLQKAEKFELPSYLTIGASYDIHMGLKNRLTIAANFQANSFYKDQFGIGFEYALKIKNDEVFMLRGAYKYEQDLLDSETRTNAHTGFAGGFTLNLPLKDGGPAIAIDYSYRSTSPFKGTHSMGLRFNL